MQAEPVSVAITVEMNGKDLGQRVRTFSVRSINECLLGYVANGTKFHDTSIFFAAYVNEENPMIDQLLREALNTRIVNRFLGYLHCDGYAYRLCLHLIFQCLIIPDNIRINRIFRPGLV